MCTVFALDGSLKSHFAKSMGGCVGYSRDTLFARSPGTCSKL